MEFAAIQSPAAAFVAGLVTSLHCAGMCGPLACLLTPGRDDSGDASVLATLYQASRLAGYATVGAVAGAIGRVPLGLFNSTAAVLLPWVMVVFFLALAFRMDKRLPRLPVLHRLQLRLQQSLRGQARWRLAVGLGAATPLLPCGPLYFLIAMAAFAGSAAKGVELMLAFGLGTLPLLWLTQLHFGWWRTRLSPRWIARVQTGLALIAAIVLTWRLRATLGFAGPSPDSFLCF